MHIICDQKQDHFWSGWFRILTAQPVNCAKWQNDFSKFRPGWWQFCWMTGVKFNSIHSILVRFLHITQFTVCAAKNLTVFVANSPRCLEWSSMVAAVSRALRELTEPCLGWTREPRRQPKSLGARRQLDSQATANNVLPARRFWLGLHLLTHPPTHPHPHRSSTPKFVTPTALSCIDNSWRSTTLSPPKKLTSSTANLEWCHVHFIRDSYSTFIRRVIGPSKNSMELFCKAKFEFKSTWNRDSATSHHKHPVCQSPAGDAEKLTNVWSMYFGTNRIIDNWHRCLGVMWRKRKNYFDK